MKDLPRQILTQIIAEYGPGLIDEPRRVKGLLKDLCSSHERENRALIEALELGVARDWHTSVGGSVPAELLASTLTQRLLDKTPMSREMARWAVESWAAALGVMLPTVPTQVPLVSSSEISGQAQAPAESVKKPTAFPNSAPIQKEPKPAVGPVNAVRKNIPGLVSVTGPDRIAPVDGMTLVYVPAGKFMMGSAANDEAADTDERPPHEVNLNAFWIDKTQVTNRQFELFVKATSYRTDAERLGSGYTLNGSRSAWVETKGAFWKQPNGPGSNLKGKAEHPVVQVSWNDANAYCRWTGRSLPTEAQWEMAARGTDGRLYPWGNAAPDANRANFGMNIKNTTEVGKYPSGVSPYGVLDMAGNVWEWVADWYGEYGSASVNNPTVPAGGTYRVLRGGSWGTDGSNLRVAYRNPDYPVSRNNYIGFRCAAPPDIV